MSKRKAVPNRLKTKNKHEVKFIDVPKDKLIRILVIAAAVILAVVLFFVIRGATDGHLPVKDGVAVMDGDTWLVGNLGSEKNPRYFKLGSVGDVEGYQRRLILPDSGESITRMAYYQTYESADEAKHATAFVIPINAAYDENARTMAERLPQSMGSDAWVGELEEINVQGVPAYAISYNHHYATPTEEIGEDGQAVTKEFYVKGRYISMQAGRGASILLQLYNSVEDESLLPTDEDMAREIMKIAETIALA